MGAVSFKKLLNRLRFGTSGEGPFRFFVRNWSGITDINILADALAAETFRASVRPKALDIASFGSILVIAPHQDDELIGAGGLMIKARDLGKRLAVCFATDGAQTGLMFRGAELSPEETVALREKEAREVCAGANAQYHCLGIGNIGMEITAGHIAALADLIEGTQAELVLAPWLFDGSAKHRAVCQLLWQALREHPAKVREVWGYQVNNTPFTNGYMDISAEIDEKIRLLEVYATQNEGLRRYEHMARGLAAWNSRFLPSKQQNVAPRSAEVYFALPTRSYCELIEEHYTTNFEATYFGHASLAGRMKQLAEAFPGTAMARNLK